MLKICSWRGILEVDASDAVDTVFSQTPLETIHSTFIQCLVIWTIASANELLGKEMPLHIQISPVFS